MANTCGQCRYYRVDRYMESICSLTGKNVGFLWNKECYQPLELPTMEKKESNTKTTESMETKVATKVCKKCGRELPLSEFGGNFRSKDGHLNTCRECMSAAQRTAIAKKKGVEPAVAERDFGEMFESAARIEAPDARPASPELCWQFVRAIVKAADSVLERCTKRQLMEMGEEGYYKRVLDEVEQDRMREETL